MSTDQPAENDALTEFQRSIIGAVADFEAEKHAERDEYAREHGHHYDPKSDDMPDDDGDDTASTKS